MKTLHFLFLMSIIISLVTIGESSMLTQTSHQSAGIEDLQLFTSKFNYIDGEIISISGYTLQNSVINIFLVDNYGNIENSTQANSNNTGYFDTNLGIPLHVTGGAWSLFAKSGESDSATQIMVNAHGENPPPFNALSRFAPLKQFKLGIESKYIQCKTGLQLIIKSEDDSPACVTSDTENILLERGWADSITNKTAQTSTTSNQAVEIVSIQMVQSLINPGGSPIQLTLKNIGVAPITNLNATLHLNYDYNFDFQDVTKSHPLVSGNSTSYTKILIGGGFTSEATYLLTVNGIANNIPFSFTQNVHIPYTNENIATKIMPENVCGKFVTAPGNQTSFNTVPVLLMNSNSTGCAKLTFTIISNYNNCNGQSCQHLLEFNSTLPIGNLHYEKHDSMISVSSGKDYTNSFKITTIPETIDLANYPIGTNFTVTYIIRPLPNATGFYDQSIPKLACERYPLAVGYTADQVNASDFSYIDPLNPPCVAGSYVLAGVEISGMDYKEVTLRLSTLG